jgi:signal transduction histidine kinase
MWQRTSPARWLLLCVLALAVAFVGSSIYSRKVAQEIDIHSNSITQNGSLGVVLLSAVTEDIRLISTAAMRATPGSLPDDRTKIDGWFRDMNESVREYRMTEDYPGERELYLVAERRFGPFSDAVDDVLRAVGGPPTKYNNEVQRLSSTSDALSVAIRDITKLNADQIAREGDAISDARRRATEVSSDFRVITLSLAVAGIILAWATSRQHIELMEDSKRFAEERANELELFAGRVAHDLRAPLTVIQMNSEAAERDHPPCNSKVAFERIARQGRRMGEMIDTLLAFAQAGARAQPGTCDNIPEVVQEVVQDCQPMAAEAETELVVEPLPHAAVACSSSVLGIIVSNLVRNAIKYMGETGGVRRVTIRMRDRERWLHFEVEDTGPGLPRGTEDRVFEPFVRFAGSRTGGIGLGLATVKRLVESHGGRVGVHSMYGRGCRFRFDLPRAHVSHVEPGRDSESDLPALGSDASPNAHV